MTWLAALNFLVLQWFGLRLGRIVDIATQRTVGWRVLRWVWPLTGWWTPYRWIARPR